MHNGQVLIGSIESASLGNISIDEIDLKMQNVKLYKIKRLVTFQRFRIETINKHIYYGMLKPSSIANSIEIIMDDGKKLTITLTDINLLIPLDKNFLKSLTGNFSLGFSYAKSSSIGQFTISSQVQYATRLFGYQLSISELASIDSSTFSRDNESASFFTNYNINSTVFIAGLIQYQRNLELSIARRYQELIGPGKKLFIRKNWQLLGVTGLAVNQEKSTDQKAPSTVLFEIPVMMRFNFYKFQHPDIQITTNQTFYLSLSEKNRVRFDGNTSFRWQLIRYFYLDIGPYTNFDSKPPAGSSNFDFGVVVSLSYRF